MVNQVRLDVVHKLLLAVLVTQILINQPELFPLFEASWCIGSRIERINFHGANFFCLVCKVAELKSVITTTQQYRKGKRLFLTWFFTRPKAHCFACLLCGSVITELSQKNQADFLALPQSSRLLRNCRSSVGFWCRFSGTNLRLSLSTDGLVAPAASLETLAIRAAS